jgi:hypothetical protein
MADARTKLEAIRRTDPFYDPDTNLDLSGCPSLQQLPSEDWTDDKFSQLDLRGSKGGGADLRRFLTQPDREAIAETKDRDLLQSYDEAHAGRTVHVGEHLFRVFARGETWHAEGNVDGRRHRFTAPTRDARVREEFGPQAALRHE